MSKIEYRDSNNQLLAFKLPKELPKGLAAYSDDEDYIQVLSWNYEAGTHLKEHIHNNTPREALRTQETVVVQSGRLKAMIYDEELNFVTATELVSGEVMIFLKGGHGYDVLEDDTQVIEIKNGPYPGPEADRRRFDP